jgi:NAD(P)-dependent dehydrogenase (short-subunit alcohol dehydrogenase family)
MGSEVQRVLIVTGASRGIGAATARLAAGRGYTVCVNYLRNRSAADAVVGDIVKGGGAAIAVGADVSTEADVVRLFEVVDRSLGRVSALVNNAGIVERQTRVEHMDGARLSRVLGTNVTACFLCAREYVDYAASKAAIDTLTIGLAKEVAAEGIRVNAVRPGVIDTEIHASAGEPDRVNRIKESIPMKRGGHAEEVAKAILWLLSDEASYATGAIVDIAGGR